MKSNTVAATSLAVVLVACLAWLTGRDITFAPDAPASVGSPVAPHRATRTVPEAVRLPVKPHPTIDEMEALRLRVARDMLLY
jgi:hypothetical protein